MPQTLPLPPDYVLPTDKYIEPTRSDVILRGKLLVSREDTKKTWRQVCGSPTAPVILTTPGTYRIVAERHSVALRAERC